MAPITKELFLEALTQACGNVTYAGMIVGRHKVHAMRLAKKFDLREVARDMRLSLGGKGTGRPQKEDFQDEG